MSAEEPEEQKNLDLSGEVPAVDVGEVPAIDISEVDESILQARDLMRTFVKTIKAFRLYPPENPALLGFREQVIRKFQQFLNQYQSFNFQIEEYAFIYKGKILYENQDVKTSLAFLLYKDGLRELRFRAGLEDLEIMELIDLIKRGDLINELEDDLVTLIWEKDFVHISYMATDEYLEDMPVIIPENVDQFRQNLYLGPLAQNVETDLEEEGGPEFDFYENLAKKIEFPPAITTNRSVYFLTPQEMEGLGKEVESEISPRSVFNVIDILFEIMALGKEPESYQNAANVLQKMLDALITLGEFQRAGDLLGRVNIMITTYELKDWQVKILEEIVEKAGDTQRMGQVGKTLDKGENIRVEEVSSYLTLLRPNAIPALIQVLGSLHNSKSRRILCNVLCVLGKNHIELLTPFVDDSRWFLVRNITYVLGRIGKEQCLTAVQKAFNHKESRVRREAVQAMGLIGGARVFGVLVKALTDGDSRIRSIAALNLARVGKKDSLPYLLEVAQSKDFLKREPGERKAFADAIGMISSSESGRVPPKPPEAKSPTIQGKTEEIRREPLPPRPPPPAMVPSSTPVPPAAPVTRGNPYGGIVPRRRFQTSKRQLPSSPSGPGRFFKKLFFFVKIFK